jgi:hypothetical protein
MKIVILLGCLAIALSSLPLAAQAPATAGRETSGLELKPELNKVVTDYERQAKAIEDEIEPHLKTAKLRYAATLDGLATRYTQARRTDDADKVSAEVKRFQKYGMASEPPKTTSNEIKALWSSLIKEMDAARKPVVLKRNALRAKYDQALTTVDLTHRAKNDTEGTALVRRARAAQTLLVATEAGRIGTTDVRGRAGMSWTDLATHGGYVVGFDVGKTSHTDAPVLGQLKPIFATVRGIKEGEPRGTAKGTRVLAKEGYAVGGLLIRGSTVIHAVQIVFMRVMPNGINLDTKDFYITEWLGGDGGGKPIELTGRGHMIIGVAGVSSDFVESLGLVFSQL